MNPVVVRSLLALLTGLSAAAAEPSLRERAAAHGLAFGTAIKPGPLQDDAAYRATLLRHFGVVTPENELKFKRLRPTRDRFDFAVADRMVDFAVEHELAVRGHTLVWVADSHAPAWLLAEPVEREHAASLMAEHINTVMKRYAGRVRDWDVVNEAVSNDNRPGADFLVDGYWRRAIGDGYMALAFKLARRADPTARLFYNDYDHGDALGRKSDRIYALLKRFRETGVPVDGVGLQLHCRIDRPPSREALEANFHRLKALGLIVQVTELDVATMSDPRPETERLAAQAQVYADVVAAARAAGIDAVVTWGFTDRFQQGALVKRLKLPADTPTPMWLFDEAYAPKPAFEAVVRALE